MKRLISNISYLLTKNDYLVVPGLGGFIVRTNDAYYDASKATLQKPSVSITFNESLNHNDGLLTQQYSCLLQVSFCEAENILNKDIIELKTALSDGQTIYLGQWGTLYKSESNNIIFSSTANINFIRPQLFGLQNLSISEISTIEEQTITANKQHKKKLILRRIITGSVAALLIYGIFFSMYNHSGDLKQYAGFLLRQQQVTTPPSPPEPISPDKEHNQVDITLDTTPSADSADITDNQSNHLAINSSEKPQFLLVVGSCRTMRMAQKIAAEFRHTGFDHVQIDQGERMQRVFVQQFSIETEAIEYLRTFRKEYPHVQAWIYVKK